MGEDAKVEWTGEELLALDRRALEIVNGAHTEVGYWKLLDSLHPTILRGVTLAQMSTYIVARVKLFREAQG